MSEPILWCNSNMNDGAICSEAVNCIGYVYYKVGLEETEVHLYPPTLEELLIDFDITEADSAVAIGILSLLDERYLGLGITSKVLHMAIIDPEKPNLIRHRRGVNQPVSHEPMDVGLQPYLVDAFSDLAEKLGLSTKVLRLVPKVQG